MPPNRGGKYVGFGSGPPPAAPRRGGQAGGIDDVLSKGFSQLTTVAGSPLEPRCCHAKVLEHRLQILVSEANQPECPSALCSNSPRSQDCRLS